MTLPQLVSDHDVRQAQFFLMLRVILLLYSISRDPNQVQADRITGSVKPGAQSDIQRKSLFFAYFFL